MAKIRAYKLAEELGIDRNEFVEKVRAAGFELKSAVASFDEEVADQIREKLGGAKSSKHEVIEKTVEVKGRGTIIRRRRRKKQEAPPEPEPIATQEPEPVAEPPVEEEPISEPEEIPVPEPIEPEAPVAIEPPQPIERATPPPPPRAPEPAPERQDGPGAGKGKQRKRVREVVNLREQEQLARQVSGRTIIRRPVTVDPRALQSPRRKRRDTTPTRRPAAVKSVPQKRVIRVDGTISVGELARALGAKAPAVQGKLMALGTMASINQAIDIDTARQVAAEFEFEVQDVGFREDTVLEATPEEDAKSVPRPPVVTVMGHVDHGKTSILDALRKENVVSGEAGGITQHIGAYQVAVGDSKLTFIDTPGHAAFTSMRARGAQATDIVVLVVAATEGTMPQTVEAIAHARSANVPIVVAINKCDLPDANPDQARQRLMEHGLVPEEFGGDTICVNTSAKKGTGLDQLLEMLKLQAEVLELKANPDRRATGVVLEAQLDKGRGSVATVLVQEGTLRQGDIVVLGTTSGRVRAMINDRGETVKEAGPSTPVQVIGLSGVPEAGQLFHVVENERAAKDLVQHRESEERARSAEPVRPKVSLDEFFAQADEGGVKELRVVIKADVQGSVEALGEALEKLSTDRVKVKVVHAAVGAVSESDIMLARASDAIVIGFHVRPDPSARVVAESQGVDVRLYQVIYEVTDEIRAAMAGLLPPTVSEKELGRAEVRQTFSIPRIGTIGGSYITEGLARRGAKCRLVRDGIQIYDGRIGSLRRFKDDVREVALGFECGIGIDGYNDLKIGDVIEIYELEEKPATLE